MALSGLDPTLGALAQPLLTAVGKAAAAQAPPALLGFSRRRHQRRAAYQRLQVVVLRTRLHITGMLATHQVLTNPVNVISFFGGLSVATTVIDRVTVDLAEAYEAWHRVRDQGVPEIARVADDLLIALAELMNTVDPGWRHPRERRAVRAEAQALNELFDAAFTRFLRLSDADAAARRRDRKAARRALASTPSGEKPAHAR